MKKLITLLALIITLITFAQAPQGFNYQAIVRNSAGALITNQIVGFKFSIKQTSASGTTVYSETQYVTPDNLGQVSLVVGTGSPSTTATFSAINWASGTYYLAIELNTGSGFVAMGTTQLLSVPYALYALNSGTSKTLGKPTILITGNITNEEAATQIAKELGSQTDNIWVMDTTILSTLDLSAAIGLTSLKIENNKNLSNVNLNGLSSTYDVVSIGTNPALTSLSFPAYTRSSGYKLGIYDNASLTSISFPVLLNLSCQSAYISGNSKLTTIGLPSLASLYTSNYYGGISISFNSNALPSSQINTLLNKLLTVAPATGKNINLSIQTPAAPPTGQGIIDKQTLIDAGNQVSTDGFVPSVTTTAVTSITTTSATSGGTITNSGGSIITDKGVVWSTSNDPTIENNIGMTTNGSSESVFTSYLTGLASGTTYYVRAYATNSIGTVYGNQVSFTTTMPTNVTIGTQTWTAKNLDVATYSDGTVIPQVTNSQQWASLTTGAWCYCNNDPANGAVYGKLYNWYAVAGIHDTDPNTPNKKLAPTGYHIPSDAEWTTLTTYLGGESIAGGKMKATGTSLWKTPNTGATNSSGFTGLPGGYRYYNGTFFNFGYSGYWWSSSEDGTADAWSRYLDCSAGSADSYLYDKDCGFLVRCLRD